MPRFIRRRWCARSPQARLRLLCLDGCGACAALRLCLLRHIDAVPAGTAGDHPHRADQGRQRAPRKGRPPPHRRPLPLCPGLVQRRQDRRAGKAVARREARMGAVAARIGDLEKQPPAAAGATRHAAETRRCSPASATWTGARSRRYRRLDHERRELEAASDVLRTLQAQLSQLEAAACQDRNRSGSQSADQARLEEKRRSGPQPAYATARPSLAARSRRGSTPFPRIEAMRDEVPGRKA